MKNSTSTFAGYVFILLLALAVTISGCKPKDDDSQPTPTTDVSNEEDIALAENIISDANRESDVVLRDTFAYKTSDNICRFATIDTAYGSCDTLFRIFYDTCLNTSGRIRQGTILVRVQGCKLIEKGIKITMTFENFYINEFKLEGKRVLENKGLNAQSQPYFNITDSLTVTNTTNSKYVHWETNRVNTWAEGYSSVFTLDDVYVINSSGTYKSNRSGTVRTIEVIIKDLKRKVFCQWPVSGTIESTPYGFQTRTIDFGTGSCDNVADLYVNGSFYKTIQLN